MEWERAEKMATAGSLTEAQAREVLADILKRAGTGETFRAPTVEAFLKGWLTDAEANKAGATAARYRKPVECFLESLGRNAGLPLTALTPRHVENFVASRRKDGVSASTIQLDAKILRTALNRARRQGLISTNPAEAVDLPKKQTVERGTFTPAEVSMLVEAGEGEWKTLILLAYFTGARLSDCTMMAWKGVDLMAGTLTFRQAKTGGELTLPLHPDLLAHLEALATSDKPQKFIMPRLAGLGTGGRHGLSEGFKRIMRRAGLDAQAVESKGKRQLSRRTFHALRHSFASALANAGVAPELRMKLTGHKSEAQHRGYTHHELATLRNAVAKLPALKPE
ncbi:MAG: site-specific integrase [Verrucomicrobiales bacterium]|nr:site-specific integrase [Verrucomicrobiales bacterium]